jgi:ATPases involved in chromosome partitioning
MLMLNGKVVSLDSQTPHKNAHRLLAQTRPGLNVFLATEEKEASWVNLLLQVAQCLPLLRPVGLVPPSVAKSLALAYGNVPVLAVPEDMLLEAAEGLRRTEGVPSFHLVLVASSKGGMGKSTFAVLLANLWSNHGRVKVVDQDSTSTLGVVLRSLTNSEPGVSLGLQERGELFVREPESVREHEPSGPTQIFICPPPRPTSSLLEKTWGSERMLLDTLLAAAIMLPGDRLIIDLPGDVNLAIERLGALGDMMAAAEVKLVGLDVYLFIQPQAELMEQAAQAIRGIGQWAGETLKRLRGRKPEGVEGELRGKLTVLYPYIASQQDIKRANDYLASKPDLHQIAGSLDVYLANTSVGRLPNQWKYWETVFDPKATRSLGIDKIKSAPISSFQDQRRAL